MGTEGWDYTAPPCHKPESMHITLGNTKGEVTATALSGRASWLNQRVDNSMAKEKHLVSTRVGRNDTQVVLQMEGKGDGTGLGAGWFNILLWFSSSLGTAS